MSHVRYPNDDRFVIYGFGGHGRDIANIAGVQPSRFQCAYDDANEQRQAPDEPPPYGVVVGINDSKQRQALTERLEAKGWKHAFPIVSTRSKVWREPGCGVVVFDDCNLTDVTIGSHTHINVGTFATRTAIGSYCTIGPNVTICGDVSIHREVMIGAGAVIRNNVDIGAGATIGCGAVVVKDVPAGMTYVGNPARPLVRGRSLNK